MTRVCRPRLAEFSFPPPLLSSFARSSWSRELVVTPVQSLSRALRERLDGNKRAKKLAGSVALAVKRMIGIGVLSHVVEGDRLWKVIGNLCRSRYVCFLPFVFVDRWYWNCEWWTRHRERKEGEKSCLEKNEKVARISYSLIEEKFKDRIFRVLISMMVKFNFWRYLRVWGILMGLRRFLILRSNLELEESRVY